MLNIAVVDDEVFFRNELHSFLMNYQSEKGTILDVSLFSDGITFISELDKGKQFDIVFMDIKMPYMNGLKAAQLLREKDSSAILIFTTIMSQYAVKGYEYNAMDYIVKPISYLSLVVKMEKAEKLCARTQKYFMFSDGEGGFVRIKGSSIYYVHSDNHYCVFQTEYGTFKKFGSIREIDVAYENEGFVKCSASYLVNPLWVKKITQDQVYVQDFVLPIARRRRKEVIQKITKYMA